MSNLSILCPHAISFKDALSKASEIADIVKGHQRKIGKSSEQVLREFLQSGDLPDIPISAIDTEGQVMPISPVSEGR